MNINEKKFKSLLQKAELAETKLHNACSDLELLFDEYFDDEISVHYQPSDGFVILHNKDIADRQHSNLNTGVQEAFDLINKDKNYFKIK